MLVASFTSKNPTMGDTKTYEDYSKYLGVKPNSLGVVARFYKDHTLGFLTDGLRNVYYNDEQVGKFLASNSLAFEWDMLFQCPIAA